MRAGSPLSGSFSLVITKEVRLTQLPYSSTAPQPVSPVFLAKTLVFCPPEKMTFIFAFWQGFWYWLANISGENSIDSNTAGGLLLRCISAVFCQTKQESGVFSTGTENNGFTGFSGIALKTKRGNGARFGRFRDSGDCIIPGFEGKCIRFFYVLGDDQITGHQMTIAEGSPR